MAVTTYTLPTVYYEYYSPIAIDQINGTTYLVGTNGAVTRVLSDGTSDNFVTIPGYGTDYGTLFEATVVNHDLYVAGSNSTIYKVTPEGVVSTFVTGVSAAKWLEGSNTHLYCKTLNTKNIYRISLADQSVTNFPGYSDPYDAEMSVGPDGSCYAGMGTNGTIKISPDGTVTQWSIPETNAYSVSAESGEVFITDSEVTRKLSNGAVVTSWTDPTNAFGMGRSRAGGSLYIGRHSSDNIYRLDPATGAVSVVAAVGYTNIDRVKVGPDKVVWAVWMNPFQPARVFRIDDDQAPIPPIGGGGGGEGIELPRGTGIGAILNVKAGTSGLDATGAANVAAGTSGLSLVGALNVLNESSGLDFGGVCNALAGTEGLAPVEALRVYVGNG